MTTLIRMFDYVGDFGEDKDAAAFMRESSLRDELSNQREVELDFTNVTLVTQSFIHALISDILRSYGEVVLDFINFRGCNEGVRGIISTVVQYSLDSMSDDAADMNIND